jgi:hypothetical protein
MIEAAYALVYDAGQVRLTQFAAEYDERKKRGLPVDRMVAKSIHLGLGLETVALLPNGADRDFVVGLLIETYGLLAVAQDPMLRPLLPLIPITGATVVPGVLAIGGRVLVANGKILILRSRLVATTPL